MPSTRCTNAIDFPSGDQRTYKIFGVAGSPVTGRTAPPLTACSVNPVEYGTAVCPFVSGLNRNPANRNLGCETSAIVDSVSGCSIAIIFLSGETDATGVAGASSSVSIPCGGF